VASLQAFPKFSQITPQGTRDSDPSNDNSLWFPDHLFSSTDKESLGRMKASMLLNETTDEGENSNMTYPIS
jgi:hypothetical protein